MEYPQEPGRGPTRLLILSVVAVVAVAALLVLLVTTEASRGLALRTQTLGDVLPPLHPGVVPPPADGDTSGGALSATGAERVYIPAARLP